MPVRGGKSPNNQAHPRLRGTMNQALIPIMNFSPKEILILATGLSIAQHTLQGSQQMQDHLDKMYRHQPEVMALMKKLTTLLEASYS